MLTVFACHGIPMKGQANNIPFNSVELINFSKNYGIELITCSPYYHQGKGMAEMACHIAEKIRLKRKDQNVDFRELLLEYRNTSS